MFLYRSLFTNSYINYTSKPNVLNFLLENTTFDENDYRLAKNRENRLTDRLSLINAKIISKEYLVPIYNFLHENGISLIEDISKMLHFLTNLENITFSALVSTRKHCENEMENENLWLKSVSEITSFSIDGKSVLLFDNQGKLILKATKK